MTLKSINPFDGTTVAVYNEASSKEINQQILATHTAWKKWKEIPLTERAVPMRKLSQLLESRKHDLSRTMALEMGKTIREGVAEIEKCALVCDYYAEHAANFLADKTIKTDAKKSYVSYQPLGIILAVMPWNFPFWQVFRFLAPNLMAGNCGILKHASNVSGCALLIQELVLEAGFTKNVFTTILVSGKNVNQIIENPLVKAVTLTGSTEAGKKVAEKAGSVLKKCVLELGGSDPYLILADADFELAAETCVNARLMNSGQSCIAAKRFIVVESVEKEFLSLFLNKMKAKRSGNPLEDGVDLGPMASVELRDELHKQVQESIVAGAKCILGGEVPDGNGAFYPPTILTNIKKGMPAYDEELFGPVASMITVKDVEEAIRVANDTPFGLGAAIFSRDEKNANEIAKNHIQAGSVFINDNVKSNPSLPFGGINQSGYGRELSSYGLLEFMNIKTISIK